MSINVSPRKRKVYRIIAVYLLLNSLVELAFPIAAYALTSGPSQPEVQSFEPVGTSDMVDLFTGDFNYNIPLFELPGPNGGYPFNIAYHSGIGMDQEASWVGLGWNLNPGAIVRNMRGMPDDFNGQVITKRLDIQDNHRFGVGYGLNTEIAGGDLDKVQLSLSAYFSLYYNNFKGVGYSLVPGATFSHSAWGLQGNNNYNFNLSLDSQEGIGVGISLSHSQRVGAHDRYFGVGSNFSSRSGITISSFGGLSTFDYYRNDAAKQPQTKRYNYSIGSGSSFSFAQNAYSPVTSNATTGVSLNISFKSGFPGVPMVFPNGTLRGFYSIQHIDHKNNTKDYYGFGYNHIGNAELSYESNAVNLDPHFLYDVNREKDGMLHTSSPNLATPNLTFDFFNVQGQGIGGSYRAYSPQAGRIYDSPVFSWGVGGSVGFEAGPTGHLGFDIELNYNNSHTSPWDSDNEWSDYYKFREFSQWDDNYASGAVAPEPIYYKSLGEMTSFDMNELEYIGGEYAVRAKLDKQGTFVSRKYVPLDNELIASNGDDLTTNIAPNRNYRERTARTNVIYPITNQQLCDNNNDPILPEYLVNYYTSIPTSPDYYAITPSQSLSRDTRGTTDISSHNAGVTALNADGNRYVYALPVYNLSHHEIAFSCPDQVFSNGLPATTSMTNVTDNTEPDYNGSGMGNTEQYFSETNLGAYAHSYLLTSILGADYIDVTGNGVTEDDLGYWVKFNYIKTYGDNNSEGGNPYKWRAPYQNALYEPGLFSTAKDDKGYIEYGEKEVYHLATVETKTHIAAFKISDRSDGMSAHDKYAGASRGTLPSYKLDAIELYSRTDYAKISDTNLGNDADVRPVKKIKFEYNYSLCDNTANSSTGLTGKLTLKKIWFEHQNNSRGSLSPYEFNYSESNHALNPDYSTENYDRWANYKSDSDPFNRKYMPYVTQFDRSVNQTQTNIAAFQTTKNNEQSAWNLREIILPTGGKITIDYEADDYAYVQHRRATQMFNVSHFYDSSNPNSLYLKTDWNTTDPTKRRVFFKLEKPIPVGANAVQDFFDQYLSGLRESDGTYQMYYKLLMKVRQESENHMEFISGYANLLVGHGGLHDHTSVPDYGLTNATTSIDNVQCYTEGFVTLDLTRVKDTDTDEYHPFAVAAWQHLRTTQPDLLHTFGTTPYSNSNTPSVMDKVNAARGLLSFLTDFEQMFKGFRKYCFEQDYGRYAADLDYCVIRLCSPDYKKFGGGCRVKSLTINDDWNSQSGESTSTYGQTYDYTTTNAAGDTISSGVASYEPQIGGDEIALRHAKHYPQEIPIFTDNDLFFEYPVNESNYPAPIVGYSKVTTTTITTSEILEGSLPATVRGTGAVVTEFYTAKEFPVITDETQIETKPFKLYIPIPFIGDIRTNNLTAAQGYAITLNDMHGKLKSVTSYGLSAAGTLLPKPESSVEYVYKSKTIQTPEGIEARALVNEVKLIHGDAITTSGKYETEVTDGIMGVDYDFFTDQRKNRNFSVTGGLDFNIESFFPFPWPSFSCFTNDVRTAVTNKIIHKTGILEKVIATDAQSTVVTENKIFDALTGRPLLVTVENNFNDPIYRYDIPAHWEYENMGAAYTNIGYSFKAKIKSLNSTWHNFQIDESQSIKLCTTAVNLTFDEVYNRLAEGDEFIMYYDTDNDGFFENTEPKGRATLIERREQCATPSPVRTLLFHSPISVSQGVNVYLQVVRSGHRNQLNVNAGSIVSLSNPIDNSNRGTEGLSSVALTNAVLAPEIAEFLNYTIDCNGQLMFKTYDLTSSIYYSSEGDHLFPLISSAFSSITVEECEGGFKLIFTAYTPSGNCTQIDCGCFSLTQKGESHLDITEFTVSGTTITVHYEDNTSSQFIISCFENSVNPIVTYIDSVLNASAITFRDYWDYDGTIGSCQSSSAAANLYAIGKKGIWRPWKDYYYSDERYKYTSHSAGTQIQGDGVFDGNGTNKRYYLYRWNATIKTPVPTQWKPNNTITKFDKDGNELENKNIIGNYSCAKFGYNNTLAVAVAANARYFEVYYQSVEDADNAVVLGAGLNDISNVRAHTGDYSILINDGNANRTMSLTGNLFQENKEYVVSMWVARANPQYTYKESSSANSAGFNLTYTDMSGTAISTSTVFEPTGEVIDGWQRIEAKFSTPNNTASGEEYVKIKIVFQGGSVGGNYVNTWFDDIRIFPANGNMVSYVYDPVTFRLDAKLDDNNYATFYHYDEEGSLFLVKQETAKGIATIQEARSHKQH